MCIDFAVYSLTLKDSNCLAPASRSTSRHQQHHVLSIMCWCFNSEHWLKKSLMVFTHHLPTGQMSGSSLSAPNNHTHLYEALKLCVPLLFRAELRKRKTIFKTKMEHHVWKNMLGIASPPIPKTFGHRSLWKGKDHVFLIKAMHGATPKKKENAMEPLIIGTSSCFQLGLFPKCLCNKNESFT